MDDPEISINYTLSYRDFVAGHKLASRQSIALFLFHFVARYVALIAAFLLCGMAAINVASGQWRLVPPILPIIFLLFLIPSIVWLSWRTSFKRLRLPSDQDPQMTFQADRNSFARRIHNMGDLTWLWSATQGIYESKDVVLIAARKGAFVIIPRQSISDAQVARLRQLLGEGHANANETHHRLP